MRTIGLALAALPLAIFAFVIVLVNPKFSGASPSGQGAVAQSNLQTYTLNCGLWRVDNGFISTIHVKNILVNGPITVTPVIFMADGAEYDLSPVKLPTAGVADVSVNDALSRLPDTARAHLSEYGSAALRYSSDTPGHLIGIMEITNITQSLSLSTSFFATGRPTPGEQTIEGLWWRHNSGVTGFVSLANITDRSIPVSILPSGSLGTALAETNLTLSAHATQLLDLDSLVTGLPAAQNGAGGLLIQFSGNSGSILANGGLLNESMGYSHNMPFWPHDITSTTASTSFSLASVGIMLGPQSAMMGFPADVDFSPYAVLRNATGNSLAVAGVFNYMPGSSMTGGLSGTPVSINLPVQVLAPRETRILDLPGMLKSVGFSLSRFQGNANLSFTFTGRVGDLGVATGSIDASGSYVFEVDPQAVARSFAKVFSYLTLANGLDSMYSVWNPTDKPQDVVVTLHYGDGSGDYSMPLHLAPQASTMVDVRMLIMEQQPDSKGYLFSPNVREGSVTFSNPKGHAAWMTIVVAGEFYNPRKGTCVCQCGYCVGYSSPVIAFDPFVELVGQNYQLTAKATYASGGQDDFTTSSSWSSNHTSYITVGYSTGLTSGVAIGSATITALFPELVDLTGINCSIYPCPEEQFAPTSSGNAATANIVVNLGPPPSTRTNGLLLGDNLTFANVQPACYTNLVGAYGCAAGWLWQLEVEISVSDSGSNWTVSQTDQGATYTINGNPGYSAGGPDGPQSAALQQSSSQQIFYIDAPGMSNGANTQTITFSDSFTAKVCSKTNPQPCACLDWNVTLAGNKDQNGVPTIDTGNSQAIAGTQYICAP